MPKMIEVPDGSIYVAIVADHDGIDLKVDDNGDLVRLLGLANYAVLRLEEAIKAQLSEQRRDRAANRFRAIFATDDKGEVVLDA
jgi:hypothetical protein